MPKKKIKALVIISVFLVIILSFIGFVSGHYVVPILMYHSVNSKTDPVMKALIVNPQTFERQMRFLRERGYNILPLESLAGLIREDKKLPSKAVAVTFDDGYKDFYKYAFPVLKKYKIPATMFLIVDEVERPDRLSWDEIKEMQASGLITFGSHSMGAEPLIKISSEDELKRQIFYSKEVLEGKLACPVNIFSYPEGFLNKHIRELVIQAGYKLAVATKTGNCYPVKDLFVLKRVRISESAGNPFNLWAKVSGYHSFFKDNKKRCR
ncbi:MAG: polysaccharide deacetylase family protein [Candidatus Omnitrophota bacterium]|jgi:peptidoglycan/xylan/chitin deacetylase (PgdA/CDA1 family)